MPSTSTAAALSSKDGYSVWAQTYDTAPNPMLSLEHRILESILPDARELDVVDLGCGTGRWLAALQNAGARSLLGIDSSPEMLQVAKSKLAGDSVLLNADCTQLSLPPDSADLVLCSFLLSYIEDASSFLEKVGAILRPNGRAFLTDLHPAPLEVGADLRSDRAAVGPLQVDVDVLVAVALAAGEVLSRRSRLHGGGELLGEPLGRRRRRRLGLAQAFDARGRRILVEGLDRAHGR